MLYLYGIDLGIKWKKYIIAGGEGNMRIKKIGIVLLLLLMLNSMSYANEVDNGSSIYSSYKWRNK